MFSLSKNNVNSKSKSCVILEVINIFKVLVNILYLLSYGFFFLFGGIYSTLGFVCHF